MDSQQVHKLFHFLLHNMYRSSSSGSVHLTPAEKQTLLLTLQQVSKSMSMLVSSCCKGLLSIQIGRFGANTPEAWLARHGHLLAELNVVKGVTEQQQLAGISRGLHAANARPGGLQLQVFRGHTSGGMAAVLAALQSCSQHLTRLELQPASSWDMQLRCVEAVKELLPQLQQLRALALKIDHYTARCAISVAHLSHLTSLNFDNALVSSEGLPSSLLQLQLKPVISINPLMQLPAGLRSVHLNVGQMKASSERQQLLEQLAAQCPALAQVKLEYRRCAEVQTDDGPRALAMLSHISLSGAEMAAWEKLPLRMLHLAFIHFVDQQDVQQFPQLLAATHKHLTELHFDCLNVEAVKRLPVGLVQLTGLRKLHLEIGSIKPSSQRQQLLEQVAAQCTSLREVRLDYSRCMAALEEGEMAAWAKLPVWSLNFINCVSIDQQAVQLFPQLLAATHKHLTELLFSCHQEDVAEKLHVGLAQLTGLVILDINLHWSLAPSDVEQLCEVVGAQLVNLSELCLGDMDVSHAAVQHLSAARSLTYLDLQYCSRDAGVDDEVKSRFPTQHR